MELSDEDLALLDPLFEWKIRPGDQYASFHSAKHDVFLFFLVHHHVLLKTERSKTSKRGTAVHFACAVCSAPLARLLSAETTQLAWLGHHDRCGWDGVCRTLRQKTRKRDSQRLRRAQTVAPEDSLALLQSVYSHTDGDTQSLAVFLKVSGLARLSSGTAANALLERLRAPASVLRRLLLWLVGFSSQKLRPLQTFLGWSDKETQQAVRTTAVDASRHHTSPVIQQHLSFGMVSALAQIPCRRSGLYVSLQIGPRRVDNERVVASKGAIDSCFCEVNIAERLLLSGTMLPVIALDATYTTGAHQWVVFTAVAMSSERKTHLISYGLAPEENQATWTAFLNVFRSRHPSVSMEGFVFITDGCKGVSEAVGSVFPDRPELLCAKHAERSMTRACANDDTARATDLLWRLVHEYNPAMVLHLEEQLQTHAGGLSRPEAYCAAAQIARGIRRYETVTTNAAESVNAQIRHARRLDAVSLVLDLAQLALRKIDATMAHIAQTPLTGSAAAHFALARAWAGLFAYRVASSAGSVVTTHTFAVEPQTERVQLVRLFREWADAAGHKPSYVGSRTGLVDTAWLAHETQIKTFQDRCIAARCSCLYGELNGLPCCHIVGCIQQLGLDSDFSAVVDPVFFSDNYVRFRDLHWVEYRFKDIDKPRLKRQAWELWQDRR